MLPRQGYTGVACDQCLTGFTEVATGVCQLLDVTAYVDTTSGVAPSPSPAAGATTPAASGLSGTNKVVVGVVVGAGGALLVAVVVLAGVAVHKRRVNRKEQPEVPVVVTRKPVAIVHISGGAHGV